jgi:hypothetical protein
MLAYGLFLPVSAAGIGLGIGKSIDGVSLWPNGMLVLLVHIALATLVGGIVLTAMHFKPRRRSGYLLPIFLSLLSLAALVVFTGLVTFIRDGIATTRHVAATPTILILPSSTPIVSQTSTPIPTNTPSATLSFTPTLLSTPSYAMISSSSGGGALLRSEPGSGTVRTAISNGVLVEVLPEIQSVGNVTWVRVRVFNYDGWVLQTVLTATTLTPTPVPPTTTPTP